MANTALETTCDVVQLSSGHSMPLLGLGTYQLTQTQAGAAVRAALRAGIRHIDCASIYRNEIAVGSAIHVALCEGEVVRSDLWLTSKLWNDSHGDVRDACLRSLRALRVDYLDLYLVHWPVASGRAAGVSLAAVWAQMEQLVDAGLVRAIGISNCSAAKLSALLASPSLRILPAVNQVEMHPGWRNDALLNYCVSVNVHVTAYAPLGSGVLTGESLLATPAVKALAADNGCTPAQLLLRWALGRGCSTVPRSSDLGRIAQNADVAVVRAPLPPEAVAALERLPQCRRHTGAAFVGPKSAYLTLSALWDEDDTPLD